MAIEWTEVRTPSCPFCQPVNISLQCAQGQETAQTPHVSPEPVAHLSQDRLAALLLPCATSDANRVLMGHAVTSLEPGRGSRGVTARGTDAERRPFSVGCDYFVAADGANSRLRYAFACSNNSVAGHRLSDALPQHADCDAKARWCHALQQA